MVKVNVQVSGLREFLMSHKKSLLLVGILFCSLLLQVLVANVLSLLGYSYGSYGAGFDRFCAILSVVQVIALDIFVIRMFIGSQKGQLKFSFNE